MKVSRIKNILIVILVVTAVYQTGMLWLDESASRNILYYFAERFTNNVNNYDGEFVEIQPNKVVIGFGDKKFYQILETENRPLEELSQSLVKEVIQNGTFQRKTEVDWKVMLESKVIVKNYPFLVSTSEYIKGFDVKKTSFTSLVPGFDTIVIAPTNVQGQGDSVWFVNTENKESFYYTLNNSEQSQKLYAEIDFVKQNEQSELFYISSKQSDFNIFTDNIFLPQYINSEHIYQTLELENPYELEDVLLENKLELSVENLFTNYASRQTSFTDGVYTISNKDTVVKYNVDSDVIEYYNYANEEESEQTLATAYSVCQTFLKKKIGLDTGLVLKQVDLTGQGLVFYFNYEYNNKEIYLSDSIKEKTGFEYAAEVVVSNNEVKRSRQLAYNFAPKENGTGVVNVDFSAALSQAVDSINQKNGRNEVGEIVDMDLKYVIFDSKEIALSWVVDDYKDTYIVNSVQGE